MKFFKNKTVLILGAGLSGKSAHQMLTSRGISATLYDDNSLEDDKVSTEDYDVCVISPGVAYNHPLAHQFRDQNKPVISEVELGFIEKHCKIIAVTGTNGKSTVTQNIEKAINLDKNPLLRKAVVCGNIGIPVTQVSKQLKRKTAIVELSSFQLESTQNLHPHISLVLNLTQDHLDRHETMQEYIRCKSQIFLNQNKKDILILNFDDENCRNLAGQTNSKVLWFSSQARVHGIYLEDNAIIWNVCGRAKKIFSVSNFTDQTAHNIQNILATILVCRLMKVSRHAIKLAVNGLKMNHRLQYIGKLLKHQNSERSFGEVLFYNDSKSTNIASTLAACKCFETQVQLLVGGLAKGQNFTELFEKLPTNVENVFVFGNATTEIVQSHTGLSQISSALPNIHKCKNLANAVKLATQAANGTSVVLLSPACSSFDTYRDYAERGEHFAELAYKIISNGNCYSDNVKKVKKS